MSSTLDSLNIDGYNIVRSDHPSGSKTGGVCCYFKESLPTRILKITPMPECLVLEMLYNNKLLSYPLSFVLLVSLLKNLHNLKCFLVNFYMLLLQKNLSFQLSLVISMQGLIVDGVLTNKVRRVTAYF